MPFINEVKALRPNNKPTIKEIADHCGVSESTMSRYFSGQSRVPEDIATKVLAYLRANLSIPCTNQTAEDAETEQRRSCDNARVFMESLDRVYADQRDELRRQLVKSRKCFFAALFAGVAFAIVAAIFVSLYFSVC